MKRRDCVFWVFVLAMIGACAADDPGGTVVSRQERRQFQIVMESKLKQLDRGIAQLNRVATENDSLYLDEIAELERNQLALRSRLYEMDVISDARWPALRDSVEFEYHGVRDQYGVLLNRDLRVEGADADSSTDAMSINPH